VCKTLLLLLLFLLLLLAAAHRLRLLEVEGLHAAVSQPAVTQLQHIACSTAAPGKQASTIGAIVHVAAFSCS
jgi:hypothetical protein